MQGVGVDQTDVFRSDGLLSTHRLWLCFIVLEPDHLKACVLAQVRASGLPGQERKKGSTQEAVYCQPVPVHLSRACALCCHPGL